MTRAISLREVSKSYTRGAPVVDRHSLDIEPGEFLVLLGPSRRGAAVRSAGTARSWIGSGNERAPLRAGPVVALDDPAGARPDRTPPEGRLPGDLIVRTAPDIELRNGMHVPLLVDLAHLFVFDQHGDRICPAPDRLPDLEE